MKTTGTKKFTVSVNYQTMAGNPSTRRVDVKADNEDEAIELANAKVRKFKSCNFITGGDVIGTEEKPAFDFEKDQILKVGDIYHKKISAKTLKVIEAMDPTYRDQVLGEHLYNLHDLMESEEYDGLNKDVKRELKQIQHATNAHGIAYIRIIYS